jgi:hypothetical protein
MFMMKKNKKLFLLCLFSCLSFQVYSGACPQTDKYDTPEFCKDFENIARCHCNNSGLPAKMCQKVDLIYLRMISTFGSIEKACRFQRDTSTQSCIDAWQCYLKGGQLEDGRLCNGSGLPCV